MKAKKYFYISALVGVSLMVIGQLLSRPTFYGTGMGRAWANIFWLGLLLLSYPLLIMLMRFILRNNWHHQAMRRVIVGLVVLLLTATLYDLSDPVIDVRYHSYDSTKNCKNILKYEGCISSIHPTVPQTWSTYARLLSSLGLIVVGPVYLLQSKKSGN